MCGFAPRAVALGALLATSLALRLAVAWQPMPDLITKALPDDAFYYFTTASNIAHGLGSTLDGRTAANGFHPLWMVTLVPLVRAFEGDAGIRAALSLTALLDTATVALVYVAAFQLTSRTAPSLFAAAVYAFNPVIMLSSANGMESALVLFTGVLLVNMCLRLVDSANRRLRPTSFAAFGLVAGCVFLARTDGVFLVAALFAALIVALQPVPWRRLAIAAAVAILVVAPWFAWSMARFGTPLQVSGEALTWLAHREFDPAGDRPLLDSVGHGASRIKLSITTSIPENYFYKRTWAATAIGTLVAAVAIAAAIGRGRRWDPNLVRRLPLLAVPTVAFLALLLAHDGIRWHTREWYFLPAVPLAALWLASAAAALQNKLAGASSVQRRFGFALVTVVSVAFLAPYLPKGYEMWRDGRYYWQEDFYDAARWMDSNLPPDAVVGAFDAGITSWFSHRTTINLDGVMNPDALHALKRGSLVSYADSAGVTHLADSSWVILALYGPYWAPRPEALTSRIGETPLVTFYNEKRPGPFGPFVVYPISQPSVLKACSHGGVADHFKGLRDALVLNCCRRTVTIG